MGHPSTENLTPFTFEPLFLTDEALRPLFVPVLKATFDLRPRGAPVLVGHAHAPAAGTRELIAELHVGPVHRQVRVLGDRT